MVLKIFFPTSREHKNKNSVNPPQLQMKETEFKGIRPQSIRLSVRTSFRLSLLPLNWISVMGDNIFVCKFIKRDISRRLFIKADPRSGPGPDGSRIPTEFIKSLICWGLLPWSYRRIQTLAVMFADIFFCKNEYGIGQMKWRFYKKIN